MIDSALGLGLIACAILRRDIDAALDIRFKNRLPFDPLFSSLMPSNGLALPDLSLVMRGKSRSLPLRLESERLLAKELRRVACEVSPFRSVLEEDTDRAEE